MTTNATKKELLEEIANLKQELERVDQRKQFEDAAAGLKMQYDALVLQGFSEEQAYELLTILLKQTHK